MKDKIVWGVLALLTISNVCLHLDGRGRDRRMRGVTERVRVGQADWQERAEAWKGKAGVERKRPEGRRERPEKKK